MVVDLQPALQQIKEGKVRVLGVTTPKRVAAAPDIPTIAEGGLPGYELVAWQGVVAPAGTPRPIIDLINKEMRRAITSEDLRKRLIAEGTDPTPSTPEEYTANLEREEAKWVALIKKLGLKFD